MNVLSDFILRVDDAIVSMLTLHPQKKKAPAKKPAAKAAVKKAAPKAKPAAKEDNKEVVLPRHYISRAGSMGFDRNA